MQRGRRVRIIDSQHAAVALFEPLFAGARDERLCVAHLDSSSTLLGMRVRYAARGEPVEFPVRTIIADAVALDSAALILAHNHPSGDPAPSATDIEATRSLVLAARPLGLAVREHLVFGGGGVASFREKGLL